MPLRFARPGLALVAVIAVLGCSSKGNDYGTGGPGTGTREFASGNLAGNGASFSHTFSTAGTFPYFCRYHGGRGGVGMSGVIPVTDPPNVSPVTFTYSIVSDNLPDYSIKTGDIVTWTNNSGDTHTVESDN